MQKLFAEGEERFKEIVQEHGDYTSKLEANLESLASSIRERAARLCEEQYVAYAPEHEFARVAQLCATAIRQMEITDKLFEALKE